MILLYFFFLYDRPSINLVVGVICGEDVVAQENYNRER